MADDAQSIIAPDQANNDAKMRAWDAFTSSKNEDELGVRLQGVGVSNDTKMKLWDAKKQASAAPATPSAFAPGDFQTMPGSDIYNPNRLGSQALPYSSTGAAVSGAMARGQMPDFPQQLQQGQSEAAGYAPGIGATIGSVGGVPGMALGSGIGTIAEARMRGVPVKGMDVAENAGLTYLGGKAIDYGLGLGAKYIPPFVNRMAGVPEKQAKAAADYAAAQVAEQDAIRARTNKFKQTDIDTAQASAEQQAKYQQTQADTAAANQKETLRYKTDLAATKAGAPPLIPDPQQAIYADLNQAIQVPARDSSRIKLGATSFDDAVTLPGRGLAQIGLKAADLAPLSPMEQTAKIAPAWHAAGQQIDALAAQATAAGKTVDIRTIDDALNTIVDENARKGMNSILTRIGRGMGLRAGDWTNITPTQALALKRQLWPLGDYGEQVASAVSKALRDQVPELRLADQHYSDLSVAVETLRTNENKLLAGTYKPKQFTTKLPTPPNIQPPPQAPTPITPEVTYGQTSPVSPAGRPPDMKAIQDAAVRDFTRKVGKGAAGVAGAGTIAGIVDSLIQGMKNKPNPAP